MGGLAGFLLQTWGKAPCLIPLTMLSAMLGKAPRVHSNYVLNRTVGDMLRSNQSISALGRLARR